VTKNYMIIDKATGLYFVGNAGQGKFEFGPRHKARRFPSANLGPPTKERPGEARDEKNVSDSLFKDSPALDRDAG